MVGKDERVEVASLEELRNWLAENHERSEGIWLVTYKKIDPRYVPYDAIVEELISQGWVDSQPRALDETRSMRRIALRNPDSAWSAANKRRVEKLEQLGRMQAAGRRVVKEAKASGAWDKNNAAEALIVPDDFSEALRRYDARGAFDAFPPSSRRIILEWIEGAKRPETRARRVKEAAEKAARGERANHYRD